MSKSNVSIKLIFACLLAVLIAGGFAAQTAGIINIRELASKIPVIKTLVQSNIPVETNVPVVSAVESENEKLRAENKLLTEKIAVIEGEKTGLQKQIDDIKLELTTLTEYKNQKENTAVQASLLAVYYKDMKPEAIVKVMDNLDDDTVITILPLLETQQVAKILALMEPHRAALITQILLSGQPAQQQ